jgi:hypothetical protein
MYLDLGGRQQRLSIETNNLEEKEEGASRWKELEDIPYPFVLPGC